jgi:acetyl-CoA synthetase
MLERATSFHEVRRRFQWNVPDRYNIAVDVCDRWAMAKPDQLALIDVDPEGGHRTYSFDALRSMSNRLANVLAARGIARAETMSGERVAVLLPQRVETAVTHLAAWKAGCISLPLFTLFGPDALLHRLADSGARVVITDREGVEKLTPLRDRLPALELVVSVDGQVAGAEDFAGLCAGASDRFAPVDTSADDPAILIYTSGTTGNPKGALHAHRVLLGHLPGVELSHDFLPQPGDRFWTPADWAWIGGLLDVLLPALHHGIAVVACRFKKFSPEAAVALIQAHAIRNVFLPPTALKMLKAARGLDLSKLGLRSIASGGETLGAELIEWGRAQMGVTINEFYGQTECNMLISSCAALEAPLPGTMGHPVPGHDVDVIDAGTGTVVPSDTEGAIAVLAPDPVMFIGYWNNPAATAEKFVVGPSGRWLLTGDRGIRDGKGRIRFLGRDDDIISSAGYRIGPAEVEDCMLAHPAVRLVGVVGMPDPLRGSVVAAYVVLNSGHAPGAALADEIAAFVKSRLAAHEYPRVIRFVDDIPLTTTGKIIRAQLRRMAQEEAGLQ